MYYHTIHIWKEEGDRLEELKIGDIVARKSYGSDVIFRVVDLYCEGEEKVAVLKGIAYRIEADAPQSDLVVPPKNMVYEHKLRSGIMA